MDWLYFRANHRQLEAANARQHDDDDDDGDDFVSKGWNYMEVLL